MREISFRGKSMYSGDWMYGNLQVPKPPFDKYFMWDNDASQHLVSADSVGQFTGYKDIQDKEIFEGDILTLTAKSHSERLGSIDKSWVVTVQWDAIKCAFVLHNKGRNLTWMFNDRDYNGKLYQKQVIGNIHDTSYLVES